MTENKYCTLFILLRQNRHALQAYLPVVYEAANRFSILYMLLHGPSLIILNLVDFNSIYTFLASTWAIISKLILLSGNAKHKRGWCCHFSSQELTENNNNLIFYSQFYVRTWFGSCTNTLALPFEKPILYFMLHLARELLLLDIFKLACTNYTYVIESITKEIYIYCFT